MPTGSKSEKEAKRRIVAKGVVAGKKVRAIAAEAGCNTRHVQRLRDEPATQFLITDLMKPHRAKLAKLVDKSITAVGLALVAKTTDKHDHMARLRAVGRTKQLLEMAEGTKPEPGADAGQVTWEEFTVMYRRRTEGAGKHGQSNEQTVSTRSDAVL